MRMLVLWYVRKSHYAVLAIGLMVLAVTRHLEDGLSLQPDELNQQVFSPAVVVVTGLAIRFATSFLALLLVVPLVRDYDADLPPRTGISRPISLVLDRLNIARAFRSLRWSHHVRQAALDRLGPTGDRLRPLDQLLDLVNVGSWVLAVVVVALTAG